MRKKILQINIANIFSLTLSEQSILFLKFIWVLCVSEFISETKDDPQLHLQSVNDKAIKDENHLSFSYFEF